MLLYHTPSSTGQGRKNMMKDSWVEIRTGRDDEITHRQNRLNLLEEKKMFDLSPDELQKDNEK